MSNLKKAILITILVMLGISVFLLVKFKIKKNEKINNEEEIRREDEHFRMMQEINIPKRESELLEMAIRGDWGEAKEYFSKEFRRKHKENESILEIKIDEFSFDGKYVGDGVNEFGWNVRQYIIKSNGKRYRYYLLPKYNYDENVLNFYKPTIDDIQIIDIIDLDIEDEENRQGVRFTEDTSTKLLLQMMFTYDGEAGLSKHFREKYPNFVGFFDRKGLLVKYENYNGKILNKFRIINAGKLDYKDYVLKNIIIIDAYRVLYLHYNLYFMIDKYGYLDDYNLELISISEKERNGTELEKKSTAGDILACLSGKKRNWQGLPISQSFREKYNENYGIFSDLEVDWVEFLCDTIGVTKYPVRMHLQDGSIKYYGLIFKLTNTNLIDDIEKIELNVDNDKNYTAEELMNMF